jgi:hypothetical protein
LVKRFYKSLSSIWWKGAFVGMIIVILSVSVLAGFLFPSGLPLVFNFAIGFLGGSLLLYLLFLIYFLLQNLLGRLPLPVVLMFLTSITSLLMANLVLRLPDLVFNISAVILIILIAFIGGTIGLLTRGLYSKLSKLQKLLTVSGLVISFLILGWLAIWLMSKGDQDINQWQTKQERVAGGIKAIDAEDPSAFGKFTSKTLFYGSGKNERRPEFGKNTNLITATVDASLLLPEWKGFKKKMREWYWGFGVKEFPLNGRVWYPVGEGPFPLVLIVHGNHEMEEYSDPGYAYLGELLASRGFILVSVDENFINATWSGDFVGKEMQVRGWLLLQHLKTWRAWNQTKDHPFYNKVDMNRIALIGHSRGGEAIAIAEAYNHLPFYPDESDVKFDFHFNIKSLISIAPTDRRYTRRMRLNSVNYLTLQGGLDSDESSFFGMRQAERIVYTKTDGNYFFKAGLYVPGGNHGQFNSVWKKDARAPFIWFLNSKPLIKEEDQQRIAKVYISGFLEATLQGNKKYLPIFEHWAFAKNWLPDLPYVNRFEDSRTKVVAGYEEDIDLTTATEANASISAEGLALWKEEELFYRDGKDKQNNSAVILGWKNGKEGKVSYSIGFKHSISLSPEDQITISFSAGDPGGLKKPTEVKEEIEKDKPEKESPPDLSIVLIDSLGAESSLPLQELIDVLPRWRIQYVKIKSISEEIHGSEWEPTLGDYQLPLNYFISKNPLLNLGALKKIEFRFDRSQSGVIILDKIGYRKKP